MSDRKGTERELTGPVAEILPPVLSLSEAKRIERQAHQHYSRAQIGVVLFAADLARLQRGNAHKLRGYGQFGKYAENVFEGITASNAQQIVRQGTVLLKLEEAGKLKLSDKEEHLPGTTGLRELSAISKRFGDDIMLQTWDAAVKSGRKVTSESVLAALGTFIQAPEPPELEQSLSGVDDDEDEPYGEFDDDVSEKERELIDRIRDLSFELPTSLAELDQAVTALKKEQTKADTSTDDDWIRSRR